VELFKLIAPADLKLRQGQVGDCLKLLESYWPRFLVANVPVVQQPAKPQPGPSLRPDIELSEEPVETGLLDKMKDRLPEWIRF